MNGSKRQPSRTYSLAALAFLLGVGVTVAAISVLGWPVSEDQKESIRLETIQDAGARLNEVYASMGWQYDPHPDSIDDLLIPWGETIPSIEETREATQADPQPAPVRPVD